MTGILISLAAFAALAGAGPDANAGEDVTIAPEYATEFVGQEMTVVGTVTETHLSRSSGNLYLNLGDFRKVVSVKIPKESLGKFPANAETWYPGKKIRVTGVITREKGLLRIPVPDPAKLKVVE